MSEWWTYRPSDFLLFSARTYYRLFERYNADMWPAQVLAIALGLALWLALWQRRALAPRAACVLFAAAWLWIGWAFHWQRFAGINWAASWFGVAFAGQAVLLLGWAALGRSGVVDRRQAGGARMLGLGLMLFGLALYPLLDLALGRPWPQAQAFGFAPDPTVLATVGLLLVLHANARRRSEPGRWLLWPIALLWCGISGMTLATLHAAEALLLPAAALLAITAAWRARASR